MNANIKLEIDNRARGIEFCYLESIKFEPIQTSFTFKDGKWIAEHANFPIDEDEALDLIIVVSGSPNSTCQLLVTIGTGTPIPLDPFRPFNSSGRAVFSKELKLNQA